MTAMPTMAAVEPQTRHLETLSLEGLQLEIDLDDALPERETAHAEHLAALIQRLWPQFLRVANEEKVFDALGINLAAQALEVELTWTGNPLMQALNRDYRGKDTATDVLSFTLLADAENRDAWMSLPVLNLGSLFISLEWADAHAPAEPNSDPDRYLMERFAHGLLHLLGLHHDTMPQFERVVGIQKRVLDAVFQSGNHGEAVS